MKTQRRETSGSTITVGNRTRQRKRMTIVRVTHELKSLTLGLLLTTELEAVDTRSTRARRDAILQGTYCLQRLMASCILYLHTVHSSRSTTFFVVFACTRTVNDPPCPSYIVWTYLLVEDGLCLTTVT